jgi:hypothetical protein
VFLCLGFVMCGRVVCVLVRGGFVMCGHVVFICTWGFCNVWTCVYLYVWVL